MKKGFTMIELIFVIVILGILASVAIPRLAATREDAEISAAVANLRTLVSDASAYYTAKGEFPTGTTWKDITNVPTANPGNNVTANNSLKVGGVDCIDFVIAGKNTGSNTATTEPAHIFFAKKNPNNNNVSAVCKQVRDSEPLKAYFTSRVAGVNPTEGKGYMAIGSSTSVYTTPTQ